jgi:hypothetical protein
MSHHQKWTLTALLLAIIFYSGSAHAQQSNPTAETAQTANAELRKKAFALLESVADQLGNLQSAENRARIGSNLVDSLWDEDEKRARRLLALVEEDIKTGLRIPDTDDPRDIETLLVFIKLRVDTVERVAKHDAQLAFAFLKATEVSFDKPLPSSIVKSTQALELHLAKKLIANNPDLTVELARSSLARGFSQELLSLFQPLNRKHKEQALILYKEILRKLRDVDLLKDAEARYFAEALANSFAPPAVDDSAFRDLMRVFTTSASANGCGNRASDESEKAYFCSWTAWILERMARTTRGAGARNPNAAEYEINEILQDGNIDEILALALKYPEMGDRIYWGALMIAKASGNVARERQIANSYKGNPEMKRQMLARIEEEPSFDDQKLADIQSKINSLPSYRERLSFLLSTVNWIGQNHPKTALKLLNQVSEIIDTMKPGGEQTQAQMAMAMMYCLVKSDRGMAIMQSLLPKLNELVEAAAKLDGYDTANLRDGEWNMAGQGVVGSILTMLAGSAEYFAWYDFDRAVSLAAQFDRTEIRLMAQLKLAQGILAGPPNRAGSRPVQLY